MDKKSNDSTNQKKEPEKASYPIDTAVFTTAERTIVPIPVPSDATKPLIHELTQYTEHGYGLWKYGAGLPHEKRLDLMSAGYDPTAVTHSSSLLHFFTMTDIHLTDKESPGQVPFYGDQWGVISGYSGIMLYTTHVLDAAVQTINALHQKKSFDFGISLGDNCNCTQYNELRWFIDVLDGQLITPDSGAKDDPIPGPYNDYQDVYQAAGLDKSIPWYQALGNHDHFWMGMFPPDDYIRETLVGDTIINLGNIFTSTDGIKSRGYYMGALDGSTPYGDIIGAGPVADFPAGAPTVPADPTRRSLLRNEWLNEFFNTTSQPQGHGFTEADAAQGFACYSFEPNAQVPLKVIVLDNTQNDDDPVDAHGTGRGSLDSKRYDWLVNELDQGQAEDKLMILATHIPIGATPESSGLNALMSWCPYAAVTEPDLIAKLHSYPNLILLVCGHRHLNMVTALKSPDDSRPELGFWEVETASLREFPQQLRTIEVVKNSDNTVSILATNVDPAVKEGSFADISRSYALAAQQIFDLPTENRSYNAELVVQLTPEMQKKLANL
ncbi:TIGR03768 family metallophosphoesterase [Acetobacterium malicum]|uniref:TIGR03768 family metallophosphoesterase n=1 Tax=Acetobacterium malicum TaxID=52692 RepID=UPI003593E37B